MYGASAITLLTVQSTRGVDAVEVMRGELVAAQIEAVVGDLAVGAAKTGALGNAGVVHAVAQRAAAFAFPLVVDPVMISKHGARLIDAAAVRALVTELLPRARLVTPNVEEAAVLAGREVKDVAGAREAAKAIAGLGARAVLVKGGHLPGEPVDVLVDDGVIEVFGGERVETRHTHGTGCTYSAAIVANLALGLELAAAIGAAKRWLGEALRTAPGIGHGIGPVNHLAPVRR